MLAGGQRLTTPLAWRAFNVQRSEFQIPRFFTTEVTEQHRESLGLGFYHGGTEETWVGFMPNYKESIDCFVITP